MAVSKQKRKSGKRITAKQVQATENQPAPLLPQIEYNPEVDEDAWGADCLTIRQRAFVDALVGPAGGVASKAAEMAGYASDNRNALWATASRLLSSAKVQQAIAHAIARKHDSPEWVRNSLIEIASSSLSNFVQVKENGETELDFTKAAEAGALGQIREYAEEVLKVGDSPAATIKRKIKIHDRRAALETLAKLDGKLVERHEVNVSLDLSALSEDDLHRLREIYAKAGRSNVPGGN